MDSFESSALLKAEYFMPLNPNIKRHILDFFRFIDDGSLIVYIEPTFRVVQTSHFHKQWMRANGDIAIVLSKGGHGTQYVYEILCHRKIYITDYACKGDELVLWQIFSMIL